MIDTIYKHSVTLWMRVCGRKLNIFECVCDFPSALKHMHVRLEHPSFFLVMQYRVLSTVFLPGGNLCSNAPRGEGHLIDSPDHWEFRHLAPSSAVLKERGSYNAVVFIQCSWVHAVQFLPNCSLIIFDVRWWFFSLKCIFGCIVCLSLYTVW